MAIGARNAASAVLNEITGSLHGIEGAARSARGALTMVAGAVGIAAAGALAYGIDQATHYQTTLVTIQNNAHLTAAEVAAMGTAIQQTAIGTESNANTMAAALAPVAGELERVTHHTLTSADASRELTAAQDLAQSSNISLTTALKSLVDTQLVYHQNTRQAAQDSTDFFQAQAQLGISADQLSRMLQRLQPRIAGSGTSIEQLLGIVREMEPTIGSGSRAIMMAGTVLQALQSPSVTATRALGAMGISLTDAQGKFIGFPAALDAIRGAYDRLPAAVAAGSKEISKQTLLYSLFGRQANVAAALVEGGAKGIADSTKALHANGTAADAAGRKALTLGAIVHTLRSDFETAMTAIGGPGVAALSGVGRAVEGVANGIARFAVQFPGLIAGVLAVVGVLGGLAAAGAVLGPLLGGLGIATGLVTSPIILVAVAIGALALVFTRVPALAAPLMSILGTLRAFFSSLSGPIEHVVSAIGNLVSGKGSLGQVGAAFGNLFSSIGAEIAIFGPQLAAQLSVLAQNFVSWIGPIIPQVLGALGQLVGQLAAWIGSMIPVLAGILGGWASAFFGWVVKALPPLLKQLLTLMGQVLAWIAKQVGPLTNTLLHWIDAFLAWLAPLMPKLLKGLGDMLQAMLVWIVTVAWPRLIVAALNFANALLSWIIPMIPKAIAALLQFEVAIDGWIIDTAGKLLGAAANLGVSVVQGIINGIESMVGQMVNALHKLPIIGSLMDIGGSLVGAATQLGASIGKGLNAGLSGTVTPAIAKATGLALGEHAGVAPQIAPPPVGYGRFGETPIIAPDMRGPSQDLLLGHRIAGAVTAAATKTHEATTKAASDTLGSILNAVLGTAKGAKAPAVSAGAATAGLSQADALTKTQQQLAIAQAKAAGQNTSLMSATDSVINAQHALALAQAKLKAVEEARYKTNAARIAAVDKAETALEIATLHLATAREKAGITVSTTMAHAQAAVTKAEQSLAAAESALAAAQAARHPNVRTIGRDEQRVMTTQSKLTDAQNALTDLEKQLGTATATATAATAASATAQSKAPQILSTTTITVAGAAAAGAISTGVSAGMIQQAASGALLVAADSAWTAWQMQMATLLGQVVTSIGSLVTRLIPAATPAAVSVAAPSPVGTRMVGSGTITIQNHIYLDSTEMKRWISQVVAEEERKLAGAATPGSPW